MFDSRGRQLAEADFGAGDAAAAGADGTAFDSGPMANAQVTLTDAGGTARSANTDASGYYRMSIKGLTPPFVVKVKRADGTDWSSASTAPVKARSFATINLSGLTDKVLSYVADGAASTVTPTMLAANPAALVSAKARLNTGLAAPLTNAGIDPAGYDPVTTALGATGPDAHSTLLSGLTIYRPAQGRTAVMGIVAGDASAQFSGAQGIAVDAAGNLVVGDTGNNVVRRISPAGVVTTFGSGRRGFSNGSATTATFSNPADVTTDAAGNIYVADLYNNAIRKITANGSVSTLVTGSLVLPSALAADASGGVYYLTPYVGVSRVAPDGTVAPLAKLDTAKTSGIALDGAGNLYVSFADLRKIVRITPAGTMSDVYAPGSNPGPYPGKLAIDAGGNIQFIDARYPRTWLISPAGVLREPVGRQEAGYVDGSGLAVSFRSLTSIAVDAGGNVLVADVGNQAIRKITPAGVTTTVAGRLPGFRNGSGAQARFNAPAGAAIDRDGAMLVADQGNNVIRKISPTGQVSTFAGTGAAGFSNGPALAASFNGPTGLAIDAQGNVYVGDRGNNVIRRISAAGNVSTLAGTGEAGSADGSASQATFTAPNNLAVTLGGDIYLSDLDNRRMRRISAGIVTTVIDTGPIDAAIGGMVADSSGTVLFKRMIPATGPDCLCFFGMAIYAIAPDGSVTQRTPPIQGTIRAMAIDGQDNLYYQRFRGTDFDGLVKLGPASAETDVFNNTLVGNASIAIDRNGNIAAVDTINAAIKIVLP